MKPHVEEIFHKIADLSAEGRSAYFREHNIDQETRREVAALLKFDPGFVTLALDRDLAQVAQRALARLEPNGMRCGPYRLGSLIGSGGMGSVFSAERVDGEITQQVAIKLLRPGSDSSLVYERFLAERQILANLSHPNIARLLDAGRSEGGQPYLVMEYIEGKTIDVYTAGFSMWSKVKLFLKVCAAVAYLHRNLVVHRDLKPANILVTADGEPKLLDFGIAKILDVTNDPAATKTPILTPDYASPEQLVGRAANTATDIYSLGAVLYKLLTSVSPHRFEDQSAQGLVATILSGRIAPPSKLTPSVKRDLEIIVLKTLRKEPQERYATVEQLTEDLENYLAARPIRARNGDSWYQIHKFLRRHWLPVAATLLAMAGLSGGMMVANRERAIAQERFLQVRQLADRFIEMHDDVAKLPGTTKIREKMVTTALDYLHKLSRSSDNDPKLLGEIGEVYEKVAQAQGALGQPNLGVPKTLWPVCERRLNSRGASALDPAYRTDFASFQTELSYLAMLTGHFPEAQRSLEAAALALEQMRKERPNDAELLILAAARVASDRADLSESEGNARDKLTFFQTAAQLHDEYLRRKPSKAARLNAYRLTTLVASALAENGRYGEALGVLRARAPVIDALLSSEPENTSYLRQKMAAANYEGEIYDNETGKCLGKPQEAVASFQHYVAIAKRLVTADPNNASALLSLARAYYKLSWPLGKLDPPESIRAAKNAVELFDQNLALNPQSRVFRSDRARALRRLAYAFQRNKNIHEARAAIKQAIVAEERVVGESRTDHYERDQLATSRAVLNRL